MKEYLLDKEVDQKEIKYIINKILEDKELWNGGITKMDKKLQEEYGFTTKESAKIETMLRGVVNRLSKKVRRND